MSYENAPATKMVATNCACCGKELVDAVSVETGVGPECRRRHGYKKAEAAADWDAVASALGPAEWDACARAILASADESPEHVAHRFANLLVHRIACEQTGERVKARVIALSALGFGKLAARIAQRLGAVKVEEESGTLLVKAPYSEAFIEAARQVPGAWWDRARNVRVVPLASRPSLWKAIRTAFPGALVIGSRGMAVA